MSSPKKRIVPEESGKSPVMQLNSVVLPAPFEPSTARRSPGRTVMVTSVSAATPPTSRVTPRSSSPAPPPTVPQHSPTPPISPPKPGNERRERIGRALMRIDIEAERGHAAGIVAHALQREAERRAREVLDREIAQRRDAECQVVKGNIGAPVDAPEIGGGDGVDAGMAVEDRPVLVGEVVERRADRQRNHDRVDALGAHRERAP